MVSLDSKLILPYLKHSSSSLARLDQTSSDSQISPSEELTEKTAVDILQEEEGHLNHQDHEEQDQEEDYSVCDGPQSLPAILSVHKMNHNNDDKFEQSGVFITDEEITVDMANASQDEQQQQPIAVAALSKIPRSPLAQRRRRSIDNSTCGGAGGSLQDLSSRSSGLPSLTLAPAFSRKQPVYRSVRTRSSNAARWRRPGPVRPPSCPWCGMQPIRGADGPQERRKRGQPAAPTPLWPQAGESQPEPLSAMARDAPHRSCTTAMDGA